MTTWLDLTSTTRVASNLEARLDARWFNVKSPAYGAVGNGVTSDTTPITNALTAAALVGGIVWFPPGTYIADVAIPDGVTVWGSGNDSTWIKGTITSVGSRTAFRDIKIGNTGVRLYWSANATDVLFFNCWLFGGNSEALIYMNDNSITNVRFVECELSGNTSTGDCVLIVDKGTVAKHMENITFTRCWFHGNDRMNFECIQRSDVGNPVVTGYRNCSLYDCVLDIAPGASGVQNNVSYDSGILGDSSVRSSGYSTVRGCKITGGVVCLELAGPTDMLIEGNDLSAPTSTLFSMSQYGTATTERHIARIIANKFNGAGDVILMGQGVAFLGNDVKTTTSLRLIACSYSTVDGNIIETTGSCAISLETSPYNTITGNQVRGGSGQSFLFIYAGTTDNLVEGNWISSPNVTFDVRDGTTQYIGKNNVRFSGTSYTTERSPSIYAVPYSTSVTIDDANIFQRIIVTNGTAFVINPPPGYTGGLIAIDILNSSGGAHGAITVTAAFKLQGGGTTLVPATTIANGKRRIYWFYSDGTNWVETGRSTADVG